MTVYFRNGSVNLWRYTICNVETSGTMGITHSSLLPVPANATNFIVDVEGSGSGGTFAEVRALTWLSNSPPSNTCQRFGQSAGGGICVTIGPNALVASTVTGGNRSFGSAGTLRGVNSFSNGAGNTATLAGFGASAHPSAHYCQNLIQAGYDDWYLPARDELVDAYQYQRSFGFFMPVGSGVAFSSSSESDAGNVWVVSYWHPELGGTASNSDWRFPAGTKTVDYRIWCFRRTN